MSAILAILRISILEHGHLSLYFGLLTFLLTAFCSFQCISLTHLWLNFVHVSSSSFFFFFFFGGAIWLVDLSFLARDGTWALGSESMES